MKCYVSVQVTYLLDKNVKSNIAICSSAKNFNLKNFKDEARKKNKKKTSRRLSSSSPKIELKV